MSALGPLEAERRCLLFLSSAFAVVGFSVGLNALVKCAESRCLLLILTYGVRANQARSYINRLVVPHGIVDIDIHGEQPTSIRADVDR